MKRILSIVLIITLMTSMIHIISANEDAISSWASEPVNDLKNSGNFRDEAFVDYGQSISRLDFVYLAVRVYELLNAREITIDSEISFSDTQDIYALKAASVGITNGIGGGKFGPNDLLTREQLATFMVRVLKLLEIKTLPASDNLFVDDHDISSWAKESIYLARSNNIIAGVGANKVNPSGTATKEMALVITHRLLTNYKSKEATDISQPNYTGRYRLSQSTSKLQLWTDYPSENIFKDDIVPEETYSDLTVYLAKNEFEAFQIALNPSEAMTISVQVIDAPNGLSVEMHQVDYVYLNEKTDSLGREGWYPDPLYPVEMDQKISIKALENTPFWFTVKADKGLAAGDHVLKLKIDDLVLPVNVHVFDFTIPDELHVKSQINLSTHAILNKYGVKGTGADYWKYVDLVKQFMIDHRLTPKSVLWSGGLTSQGGAPYIDYDSSTGNFYDPHGIWGFELPASRYLNGNLNTTNQYLQEDRFNEGTGFPSFMAMTFQNNDSSKDQRPSSFEGISRSQTDWYTENNLNSSYNQKWFRYIDNLETYLKKTGYIDKAYYYFANEPQNQEDYDAVSWYANALKSAAPDLKLMVSEEPKAEIYNNPKYPGTHIDIWLPVLNNYNPEVSWARKANFTEETWIYFLHGTKPPYFNPITLDHPSIEQKLTGWYLWKYRIEGIAHYSFNNWSKNPWEEQMTSGHNGDNFMLYPPGKDNQPIQYGATNHRLVTSIRLELMRDSLEDYEYLYMLNNASQPKVYAINTGDQQADKIIYGLTSYNRNSHYNYTLRKNIGLKISGFIDEIAEIEVSDAHERARNDTVDYYINFQNPDGEPSQSPLLVDGKTYMKIGWNTYNSELGYGWYGDMAHVKYQHINNGPNPLMSSILYDDWGREKVFEFDLANGVYDVTVSCGWQGRTYKRNQITIEGLSFINDEATAPYLLRTKEITVKDNRLTMEMGIFDEYTMLNYLIIKSK